jgi:hypothetical protein
MLMGYVGQQEKRRPFNSNKQRERKERKWFEKTTREKRG